jgi:hypothetical protein
MIRRRIVEFKDDNGNSHFRCQYKGWFFWWYYRKRLVLFPSYTHWPIIEFETEEEALAYLKEARGTVRRRVGLCVKQ